MSKIGTLRRSTDADTPRKLIGSIRTLSHSVNVHLDPTNRSEEGAPAYTVSAITAQGEAVEIGVAWVNEMEGNRKYLSIALDDPSWTAPLNCAAFPTDQVGEYDVIWNRPKRAAA